MHLFESVASLEKAFAAVHHAHANFVSNYKILLPNFAVAQDPNYDAPKPCLQSFVELTVE
eukprot:3544406-Amphidinium_carterae.1